MHQAGRLAPVVSCRPCRPLSPIWSRPSGRLSKSGVGSGRDGSGLLVSGLVGEQGEVVQPVHVRTAEWVESEDFKESQAQQRKEGGGDDATSAAGTPKDQEGGSRAGTPRGQKRTLERNGAEGEDDDDDNPEPGRLLLRNRGAAKFACCIRPRVVD
ncbi:unnamed protein product [Closterium sp. Yama58-4]|nr:unnamed protein product [Closterium sp. Yama58-4]